MKRFSSFALALAITAAGLGLGLHSFTAVADAQSIRDGSYLPPRGPFQQRVLTAAALGGTVEVDAGGETAFTLIPTLGERHVVVVAVGASASTLVLRGYADAAGAYQVWQSTRSLTATSTASLAYSSDVPFAAFQAHIDTTGDDSTHSVSMLGGLAQY